MVSQMNLELIPKSSFRLDCSWLRGWLFLVLTLSGLLWHISELAHAQQILSTQEGEAAPGKLSLLHSDLQTPGEKPFSL